MRIRFQMQFMLREALRVEIYVPGTLTKGIRETWRRRLCDIFVLSFPSLYIQRVHARADPDFHPVLWPQI